MIGFDDHQMAELMDLSTVRQPRRDQALRSPTACWQRWRIRARPPCDVVVDTELVIRGSDRPGELRRQGRCCRDRDARRRGEPVLPGVLRDPGIGHRAGRPPGQRDPRLPGHDGGADRTAPADPVRGLPRPGLAAGVPGASSCRPTRRIEWRQDGSEDVPDTLAPQVPLLLDVLDALGLAVAGAEGFEADDVIGHARDPRRRPGRDRQRRPRHARAGHATGCACSTPARGSRRWRSSDRPRSWRSTASPRRAIADFAVLRGDPSDGLPGVAGVGEKTAAALVSRFGTIEDIVAAADSGDDGFPAGAAGKVRAARDYLAVAPLRSGDAPTPRSPRSTTRFRWNRRTRRGLRAWSRSWGSARRSSGCSAPSRRPSPVEHAPTG